MRDRLTALGWSRIETVDEDLGRSAVGGVTRAGFDRMVAEVCLGNSRDWQQLIEMCRVVDTVLVDQETVYAPRQGNDRLLLGLKGSLNEYELDLLRQRSLSARYEKARRGELIVTAPVGFVKVGDRLEKSPCPGRHHSRLRQGGRTRQRPAGPALVPRAWAGFASQAQQR
ncbi:recombinase family protein [Mesorhizobium sp. M0977]|uniref:recombinase family protein n=1 Tax=Mesorhizobium sp. M0977 TaxID=2957039 RepID=UPI00333DF613